MISKKLKNTIIILILIPFLLLTGCWSSREINTLAMVICIGIDKSPNGFVLTQQVLNPKAIASKAPVNEPAVFLYTEEGVDLFETIRRTTTKCPRKIYYSHLRMVVFSEAVAQDGIKNILDFLTRDHELRTDFYFTVAKGTTAKKILSVLTPIEAVPGIEMFNSLKTSEKSWAPTKSIKIIELANTIVAEGKNPVLTGVEITGSELATDNLNSLKQSDLANMLKYTGLGAFRKDKLVGWLSEDESKGYNYITGNVKNTVGYFNYDEHNKISFEINKVNSKIKAHFIDGKPAINVEINVEQNIGAVAGDLDVTKEDILEKLNILSEEKLTEICDKTIKTVKENFRSDIFGFGEAIHRAYPEEWKKLKEDWNNKFVNLPVSISVHTKTKQLGQITKPLSERG